MTMIVRIFAAAWVLLLWAAFCAALLRAYARRA